MFERELRTAVNYFDYSRAVALIGKICKQELKNHRYQMTDTEDTLYWELEAKIDTYEANQENKPKINGNGIWVEIYPVV